MMLREFLDFGSAKAQPYRAILGADSLGGAGGNDVMRLVEAMNEADDEVTLAGRIVRPRDLPGVSVACLDPKALDAVVGAEHPLRKRPQTRRPFL
jgi:hypothetical protein